MSVPDQCRNVGGRENKRTNEVLNRPADVENRFAAGADDGARRPAELGQVGRDVERVLSVTVNAA